MEGRRNDAERHGWWWARWVENHTDHVGHRTVPHDALDPRHDDRPRGKIVFAVGPGHKPRGRLLMAPSSAYSDYPRPIPFFDLPKF